MRIDRSKLMRGVALAFSAIALFFLVTEHRAHTLGALPHVLLGLCVVLLYLSGWHAESEPSDPAEPPSHGRMTPD